MILRSDCSKAGCCISPGKEALKHLVVFSSLPTIFIHADVPKQCLQSLYCQKLQASVQILVMSELTISLWQPSKDCLDIPIQLIRASVFYCSAKVAHVIGSWVCPGACDWVLILIGASHPQLPRGSAELQSENIFQLSLHIWTYQKARMTCLSIRFFFVFLQDLLQMP